MRPLSLPGFLSGVQMGAAVFWLITAAWIETAPAFVLTAEYAKGGAEQGVLDRCGFEDVLVLGDPKVLVAIDRLAMSLPVLDFAQGGGNPAVQIQLFCQE